MGARPTVRSFPLGRGKCGMFFWPGQRNRSFDLVPIVVGMCLLLSGVGCEEKVATLPPTPPEVEVTDVVQRDVPIYQEWVAQLNGQVNADITPKVQGYLVKRDYS
jgi:hypothetical protein